MRHSEKLVSEREFVTLTALLISLEAMSIEALLPALGNISKDLAIINPNHAQYLISFIFLGLAIGQLFFGPWSDSYGRKKILTSGILLFVLGSLICYFSTSFPRLLFGRLIQGLGVSGPYVAAVSIVRDKFSGRNMAKIMSLVMMIFITIPAIAPSLGQAILLISSWRTIFLFYVVFASVIGIWAFFRLEETLATEDRVPFNFANLKRGFCEVTGNKSVLGYTSCMGICFGGFLGYLNSATQIFQIQFGAGKLFTVYLGLLGLVLGFASLQNSKIVEKLGMYYICLRSFLSLLVTSAIFLVIGALVEIQLWMYLSYAIVIFCCFGFLMGNLNSMALEPLGHIAGLASAIIGSISTVISLSLGAVIGQLYNDSVLPIVTGVLLTSVIALGLMVYADKHQQVV